MGKQCFIKHATNPAVLERHAINLVANSYMWVGTVAQVCSLALTETNVSKRHAHLIMLAETLGAALSNLGETNMRLVNPETS